MQRKRNDLFLAVAVQEDLLPGRRRSREARRGGVALQAEALRLAADRFAREGRLRTRGDVARAALEGATARARPLLMTVASDAIGLLPILWGSGTGSETMRRIAAPMVGGVLSATLVTLLLVPVLFVLVRGARLPRDPA